MGMHSGLRPLNCAGVSSPFRQAGLHWCIAVTRVYTLHSIVAGLDYNEVQNIIVIPQRKIPARDFAKSHHVTLTTLTTGQH